jgi:hypothetical protein
LFIIGPDGKFIHPPPNESLRTGPERQFFQRTSSVWLSGEKFAISSNNDQPAANPPINQVFAENFPNQSQLDYSQNIQSNDAWSKQQLAVQNTVVQTTSAAVSGRSSAREPIAPRPVVRRVRLSL